LFSEGSLFYPRVLQDWKLEVAQEDSRTQRNFLFGCFFFFFRVCQGIRHGLQHCRWPPGVGSLKGPRQKSTLLACCCGLRGVATVVGSLPIPNHAPCQHPNLDNSPTPSSGLHTGIGPNHTLSSVVIGASSKNPLSHGQPNLVIPMLYL